MTVEHRTPNIEHRILNERTRARHLQLNIRCSMLDVRCSSFLLLAFLTLATITGCQPPPPTPIPPGPTDTPKMRAQKARQLGQVAISSSVAQAAELPQGMRVEIYQLQVPFGTISKNAEFWKHIDENA